MSDEPGDKKNEFCPRCGKPMAAQDKFCASCAHPKGDSTRGATRRQSTVLIIAAAIVLLVMALIIPNGTTTAPPAFNPATLLPGATVQLRMDAGTAAPVVPTQDLYKKWMRLGQAKDDLGIQKMTDDGQMLWTPNGTRAKILESHDFWDGSYNVRILDGPLYGQSVWTSKAFVKEDKPASTNSDEPSAGRQVESTCSTCPAPGTSVTIQFSGHRSKPSQEGIQTFISKNAFHKKVDLLASAGNAGFLNGNIEMFRQGQIVNVRDGTSAVVVGSARFKTSLGDEDGVSFRVVQGTCETISGQQDCTNRVLWVGKVFVNATSQSTENEAGPPNESLSTDELIRSFRPRPAIGYEGVNHKPVQITEWVSPFNNRSFRVEGTFGGWDKCCGLVLRGAQTKQETGTDPLRDHIIVEVGFEGEGGLHDAVLAQRPNEGDPLEFDCGKAGADENYRGVEVFANGCKLATPESLPDNQTKVAEYYKPGDITDFDQRVLIAVDCHAQADEVNESTDQLWTEGKGFYVEPGEKVKVLEVLGGGYYRISVQTGASTGREGIVRFQVPRWYESKYKGCP